MIGKYAHDRVLIVPSRVALLLWRSLRFEGASLDELRVRVRGNDPELDAVLASWCEVAAVETRAVVGSVLGSSDDNDAVPLPSSSRMMSTAEVAAAAMVSTRAVTTAIEAARLQATRCGHVWLIDEQDAAAWIAKRKKAAA